MTRKYAENHGYDEPCRIVSKYGAVSKVGFDLDEESFWYYTNVEGFDCYVKCRFCNNRHNIKNNCEVCDLPTRIKHK